MFPFPSLALTLVQGLTLLLITSGCLAGTPTANTEPTDGGLWFTGEAHPAPLLATHYRTTVAGLIAVTHLEQTFLNDSPDWQEAIYRFPLPENAALFGMELIVGEQVIRGEIREQQAAAHDYARARAEGRAAAMVQQHRPNLFTQKVANIAPGASVTVRLAFQQTLHYSEPHYELVLPLTLTPRYEPAADARRSAHARIPPARAATATAAQDFIPAARLPTSHRTRIDVHLAGLGNVASVTSPSHPLQWQHGSEGIDVTLQYPETPMDRDFVLQWELDPAPRPRVISAREALHGRDYLQILLEPPQPDAGAVILPREQTWIIDTSGSMEGQSLEQAKAALLAGLDDLSPQDRFNVIEFNDQARALFGHSVQASPEWLNVARRRIERLTAEGGTEMASALQMALQQPVTDRSVLHQVVFLTDGSVSNEEALFDLIHRQLGARRLFTIGIGSAPNRYFMRRAAEFGRGRSVDIRDLNEVSTVVTGLSESLRRPVLRDLEITLDGQALPEGVLYPARLPDLYAGMPLALALNLPSDNHSPRRLVVSGVLGEGNSVGEPETRWQEVIALDAIPVQTGIGRAWARAAIADWQQRRQNVTPEERRQRILALALEFSLISPYTRLVAVDATPARPRHDDLTTTVVPTLLPAGSTEALSSFPQTGAGIDRALWLAVLLALPGSLGLWAGLRRSATREESLHG